MPIPSDQAPPGQDWLVKRIADLERQVRELQAARRLESATIGRGGLTVDGGTVRVTGDGSLISEYADGGQALAVGPFAVQPGDTPAHGVVIRRPDGSAAFFTYGIDGDGASQWTLYDLATSGQGLATPYIPLTAMPGAQVTTLPFTTTSTSFVTAFRLHGQKQHPVIKAMLMCQSDATTTGEVRLFDVFTSAQIGSTLTIPAGDSNYRPIEAAVTGTHLVELIVNVEVRRTSGTGSVRLGFAYAQGKQS